MVQDFVLEEVSSDNMGNNESKDGALPAKEGISLTKFPMVEEERVAFLLYHMNIFLGQLHICPQSLIEPKISLGEGLKG